jgi:DNA-binding ferritin-like protein
MKRYNRENRVNIKRYNKKRNDDPEKHTRIKPFGVRSMKDRNKEAMAIRVASMYIEARPKTGPGSHSGPGVKRRKPMRGMAKLKAKQSYIRNKIDRLKYQKLYYKKNKRKIQMYRKASSDKLMYLQMLLSGLRAAHFAHWTTHWQVQGQSSYGDHLLMERLYTGLVDEIDTLAEKLVGEFGPGAVEPESQVTQMSVYIKGLVNLEQDPIYRAMLVEEGLQQLFNYVYNKLEGQMSLGLDDYIMSTANAHETNVYLLRQRTSK